MSEPSGFYLIYNDEEGSFVSVNKILTVSAVENAEGSAIRLIDGTILYSPFRPRQILYKIRIVRHKLKLENEARKHRGHGKAGIPPEPEPPDEVDGSSKKSS